jgi:hypothetical protein
VIADFGRLRRLFPELIVNSKLKAYRARNPPPGVSVWRRHGDAPLLQTLSNPSYGLSTLRYVDLFVRNSNRYVLDAICQDYFSNVADSNVRLYIEEKIWLNCSYKIVCFIYFLAEFKLKLITSRDLNFNHNFELH